MNVSMEMNRVSSVRLGEQLLCSSDSMTPLSNAVSQMTADGVIRQWLRSRIEDSYPQKDVGAVTSVLTSCRVTETHSCIHNVFPRMRSNRSVMNIKVTSISLWKFLYQIFPRHVVLALGPLGYLAPKV